MKILALDTSQNSGSVALLEGEKVLYETLWQTDAGHTLKLSSEVQEASRQTKIFLAEIDLFAVTIGPGSFTGVRVALSFIKGIALQQNKPVVGVSTLLALASAVSEEGLICPLLDARRDEIFSAVYQHKSPQSPFVKGGQEGSFSYLSYLEEKAESPESFLDRLSQKKIEKSQPIFFLGSGVRRYPELVEKFSHPHKKVLDPSYDLVKASSVGRLAVSLFQKGEFSKGGESLIPQYLRASEAEVRLKKVDLEKKEEYRRE